MIWASAGLATALYALLFCWYLLRRRRRVCELPEGACTLPVSPPPTSDQSSAQQEALPLGGIFVSASRGVNYFCLPRDKMLQFSSHVTFGASPGSAGTGQGWLVSPGRSRHEYPVKGLVFASNRNPLSTISKQNRNEPQDRQGPETPPAVGLRELVHPPHWTGGPSAPRRVVPTR